MDYLRCSYFVQTSPISMSAIAIELRLPVLVYNLPDHLSFLENRVFPTFTATAERSIRELGAGWLGPKDYPS